MKTKEYRTVDKSTWGTGPWQDEPDKVQWPDETTGLPCLVVRSSTMGAWCGYVGVAEGHPLFGKMYDEVDDFDVHGGLTFSDHCEPDGAEASRICHVPGPGEPDHVWWFGFDCGHAFDLQPGMMARLRETPLGETLYSPSDPYRPVYRPLAFAQAEVTKLAAQLAARALS